MTAPAAPVGRPRSRAVATWLALVGGSLGLHRFYLHGGRDLWAWLHPWPTLVGAYGFDEGVGTTTADQSGTGNNASVGTAAWTTAGKYGNALSFNGTSASVRVADANSLDLTTGLTLEAWVKPNTAVGWQTVAMKESPMA